MAVRRLNMTDYTSRITQPGSNVPLRISDLLELLNALKQAHGDLWCYIYSADKRASVPILSLNLDVKRTTVTFSAQTGSVVDEQLHDLVEEVERLRSLQPYDPILGRRVT